MGTSINENLFHQHSVISWPNWQDVPKPGPSSINSSWKELMPVAGPLARIAEKGHATTNGMWKLSRRAECEAIENNILRIPGYEQGSPLTPSSVSELSLEQAKLKFSCFQSE